MNGKKLDVPDWFICFLKGASCCMLHRVLFCLYRIENNIEKAAAICFLVQNEKGEE
jgi:hypothetical protein